MEYYGIITILLCNYFLIQYSIKTSFVLRICHSLLYLLIPNIDFHLQHIYNAEDEQSPNFPTSHHPTNVKFEDSFFQCFVENGSTYKYGEEVFLNRFLYKRVQGKFYKTHERFYEHVKKTKPIRSMFDVKKQYLTGSNQVNCKTYFCFYKGDH
ncbi:uncharacterized protein LOC112462600 [Temnothorax curvispinosus]|uniref:Uncharacterized protein LOC112462600 n=1 Tax=Temnothorax curvispinosus TaxID=300111 RepID=A0A6J1QP32_9HYME|nr:uncharacterized protein LOC112462600 [Temnothorax curvispinosus]